MKAYIKSTSAISPQQTFDRETYLKEWVPQEEQYFQALEPSYKTLINPRLLRRMSRIIKMGVASAKDALQQAHVEDPEAIIVGTGLGCMDDTEKFLRNIIDSDEGILSPTSFIQSTHNTVAGQIALLLKCKNYNFTYTNRGHSFENALIDAHMLLAEGRNNVLVGAAEEATEVGYKAMYKIGCVGDNRKDDGPAFGEGASFFVLTQEEQVGKPYLEGILTGNFDKKHLLKKIEDFLTSKNASFQGIDAVVIGQNEEKSDPYYEQLIDQFDNEVPIVAFKSISGEHFTASGFGMHLAVKMLEQQEIFQNTLISGNFNRPIRNVLVYNHYKQVNHTLMLLAI